MSAVIVELTAAQEAALRASGTLPGVMGLTTARVHNGVVPVGSNMPYILIGEDQVTTEDETWASEAEVFSTVNVWAKPEPSGAGLARAIAQEVKTILNTALALASHDVVVWGVTDELYMTDPDGSSRVRMVFRYLTTELYQSEGE